MDQFKARILIFLFDYMELFAYIRLLYGALDNYLR